MSVTSNALDDRVGSGRRWAMLAAGTAAQGAAAVTIHGPAFLIPELHDGRGLSLAEAGLVAAAPTIGVMATLVLWGLVTDRRGERFALLSGLVATTAASALATQLRSTLALAAVLFVAGAAAASTGSSSGRLVAGWFPRGRRGLAMGIRQMAQPVGVGVAAITMAALAAGHGIGTALWAPTVATALAVVVVALVVVDPPRPERSTRHATSPYRQSRYLTRIHGVSVLLVVPQFLVWTFALVWLVEDRGWTPGAAGTTVAGAQLLGALGRIAAGHLSDVVGSRMRPLRWVAWTAAATMGLLGLTAWLDWAVAVVLMVVATAVTVADNGLAFTAVAERAGPFWSGRALGLQNTAQYLTASAVPPLAGLLVTEWGYAAAFAFAACFPVAAVALVPRQDEHEPG